MGKYINFNDESIPLGKRKQAYIRWAVYKKGKSMDEAKILANRKFGFEKKKGLLLLCYFYHKSNSPHFESWDLRKYQKHKSIDVFSLAANPNEAENIAISISEKYKNMGWDIEKEYWYD